MRQSVSAEIAWAKRTVSRGPRNGWTVSRSGYHSISAWKAGRELSSVRFMLVIRAWRRMWSSCAWRISGGAES